MRKPVQKIVALCCVGAMALCFASCKPDAPADATTTSAPATTEATTQAGETQATEAPVTTPGAPAPAPGNTKPADKTAGVKLYNDALAKATKVSATVTRMMNKGEAAGLANLMELGVPAEFNQENVPLDGAKLSQLDANSVASMDCVEQGDNYVMTFMLNSLETDATAAPGNGGYMYLLDYNTINTLIDTIGKKLGGDSFKLTVDEATAKLTMSQGKLVVTVNKTTGAMSSAVLSFVQDVNAKVKFLGLPVKAEIQGQGTVNYTVA